MPDIHAIFAATRERYRIRLRALDHRKRIARQAERERVELPAAIRSESLAFVDSLVKGHRDLRWHEVYAAANGKLSPYYLPGDIFHALLLPVLNREHYAQIFADKNQFDLVGGWPSQPETHGRLIRGRLLDRDFQATTIQAIQQGAAHLDTLIVKPSRVTGAGKRVERVPVSQLAGSLVGRLDAIIQAPVRQHDALAAVNASSVNTIRATTYRKRDGEILLVGAAFRCGRAGSVIDNQYGGGLVVGIDAQGRLEKHGLDRHFQKYPRHPDSGFAFEGHPIPAFDSIQNELHAAHARTPWLDLAAWDTTIDQEGSVRLIEINRGTSLNVLQLPGGPVFEHLADDIRQRIGHRRYSSPLGFI